MKKYSNSPTVDFIVNADVEGSATCLPFNGQDCGQIVVDLKLRGGLADTADPTSVGSLQWQMLGSLIRNGQAPYWSALDARGTIGANPGLIESILTMNEP